MATVQRAKGSVQIAADPAGRAKGAVQVEYTAAPAGVTGSGLINSKKLQRLRLLG